MTSTNSQILTTAQTIIFDVVSKFVCRINFNKTVVYSQSDAYLSYGLLFHRRCTHYQRAYTNQYLSTRKEDELCQSKIQSVKPTQIPGIDSRMN